MKTISLVLTFTLFASCAATSSHRQDPLDQLFLENLDAYDRYANGKVTRSQLSAQQVALMYLLTDWTSKPAEFDHNKGLKVTKSDVAFWKEWYRTKKEMLNFDTVQKAIELQAKFFREGLLSDEEMRFLEKTSEQFRAF